MPDTTYLGSRQSIDIKRADGWLVVARRMKVLQVKPPYQYSYSYSYFSILEHADAFYLEHVAGEYPQWEPVAIVACRGGVPFAELGHQALPRAPRSGEVERDLSGE